MSDPHALAETVRRWMQPYQISDSERRILAALAELEALAARAERLEAALREIVALGPIAGGGLRFATPEQEIATRALAEEEPS